MQDFVGRAVLTVRILVVISCLIALGATTACAPGRNDELRALVGEAVDESSATGCEWGSSDYDNEPKSWYGCWDYYPGDLGAVGRLLEERLVRSGFKVSSRRGPATIHLTGVRGAETLCVDVLGQGFVRGRNTAPIEVEISPGEVFVDVWAIEPRDGELAARCAELPAFSA